MRYFSIIIVLVIIAANIIAVPVKADTRYVVDELVITLRQGKSVQHKILKTLRSGTPMEVLEEHPKYFKVRISDGTEGYVLRQYVGKTPPKTLRIKKLEIENNGLLNKVDDLEKNKAKLETKLDELQEKYSLESSESNAKSADLKQNLELAVNNEREITEKYNTLLAQAENVVEIANEREKLLQENVKLTAGIKELRKENKEMNDSKMIKWFLAGAGVFFFGWMIGKISRKKRSRL
jgi:SH3 domain protein